MASKSGNSGKPKSRKQNLNVDDENPVAFANEMAALNDRAHGKTNQTSVKANTVSQKSNNMKEVHVMNENQVNEKVEQETVTSETKAQETEKVETETQAQKMSRLMAEGKTMEEALAVILEEAKVKTVVSTSRVGTVDRVAVMGSENNIESLRKRIKIAFAKKSKSKGKPDAEERYQKEIEAGQSRLNELLAEVNQAPDPVAKAIELGEAEGTVLQMIIGRLEDIAKTEIEKLSTGITQKALKDMTNSQSSDTSIRISEAMNEYKGSFLATFDDRKNRGDQRCITLVKRFNLIQNLMEASKAPETTDK